MPARLAPSRRTEAHEVADFVEKTMNALSSDRQEIAVGLAGMLRIGARLAPSRFFSLVNG
jgi:hypothetical protein